MEWIDQLQQVLCLPMLALLREYWLLVLIVLSLATWFVGGMGRRTKAGDGGPMPGEGDTGGGRGRR